MSFATNKLLLLCFCVLTFSSISQSQFKTYTKSDGLTSSTILFTHVDSKGVIWAATYSGLNAFTGKEWVSIKSISDKQGRDKNLGKVLKIFETNIGHLWVATEKGIFYFNREYWTHYSDSENSEFYVKDIFEDSKSRIWVILEKRINPRDIGNIGFSFVEGRVQLFTDGRWFDFLGMIGGSAAVTVGESTDYFTSIFEDSDGNIWVSSLDGVYIYDNREWVEFNGEVLPSDKCYKVLQTSDNEIWVASSYGVARRDGDEWIKYERSKGLKDNITYDLFEDNENRLWAFTRKDQRFKALCYYEEGKWKSCFSKDIQIKGEINKLINLDGKLLAFSSKGVSVFDGSKWKSLGDIYTGGIDLTAVTLGRDNSIWIAGRTEIYKITNSSLVSVLEFDKKQKVSTLFESSNGELWIGTDKSGLFMLNKTGSKQFTNNNGLTDNHIVEIFEDKRNNIWVVTRNGISRLLL